MAGRLASAPPPGPTPAEWRAAMGAFPTGVTIVTTWNGGAPMGSTVNAFCSVSLEPPLLLVCLARANPICGPVEACGLFGVNMLCDDSEALARRFGDSRVPGRFDDLAFHAVDAGAPQLGAAPVFIDCAVENIHAAGDHLIVVGRGVRTHRGSPVPPLLYHLGGFPKMPAPL